MGNFIGPLSLSARAYADAIALSHRGAHLRYGELYEQVSRAAAGLVALGVQRDDRVAIWLNKRFETVVAFYACAMAGAISVPINPQLRPRQAAHIITNSGSRVLVTTAARYRGLPPDAGEAKLVCVDDAPVAQPPLPEGTRRFAELLRQGSLAKAQPRVDRDPAAILYTSGSTGLPKGVVLSHRNLVAGAESVNSYLGNGPSDVILGLLPLSFDAGLSQLTTSVAIGARLVLHDYLLADDVARVCTREKVTCITGVPPLWMELAGAAWPEETGAAVRIFANTGGHMPEVLLTRLRRLFPRAKPYLMYGLTEAFRSTYLDPDQAGVRPDSIGKAVPNAEILVLRPDGTPCEADEPGELVHRGAFVTLGYWDNPEATALRFRPLPSNLASGLLSETAVWSGDLVRRDTEGFLYYVGRMDDLIKSSGYRVSPNEVEEAIYRHPLIKECVVFGVPDDARGQAIVSLVVPKSESLTLEALQLHCRAELPTYMVPRDILIVTALERNGNGKMDRQLLKARFVQARAAPGGARRAAGAR